MQASISLGTHFTSENRLGKIYKTSDKGTYIDDLIAQIDSSGTILYAHCDRQFNVRGLTDANGAIVELSSYTPYGTKETTDAVGVAIASSTVYGFTGRRFDEETGLWYFRARYYDEDMGRFISRDPLGYVDGYSLYTGYFAEGFMLDPLGLEKDCYKVLIGPERYGVNIHKAFYPKFNALHHWIKKFNEKNGTSYSVDYRPLNKKNIEDEDNATCTEVIAITHGGLPTIMGAKAAVSVPQIMPKGYKEARTEYRRNRKILDNLSGDPKARAAAAEKIAALVKQWARFVDGDTISIFDKNKIPIQYKPSSLPKNIILMSCYSAWYKNCKCPKTRYDGKTEDIKIDRTGNVEKAWGILQVPAYINHVKEQIRKDHASRKNVK